MKALLVADGRAVLREWPERARAPGEARVRVRRAGICATDLEIVRGYASHTGVLGHEMVGEVLEHDDVGWVGARVAVSINVGCGACPACARGEREHCQRRTVMGIRDMDGCFAPRVLAPAENLLRVPDEVDDDAAVFVEPLAAAFRIATQLQLRPGAHVAVVGDGKLGLLIAMALRADGIDVTQFGRHPRKLAIAEACGVEVRSADADDARTFAVVVEATGSPTGLEASLARVRPGGTLVLKSTFAEATAIPTARLVVDEIRVVGSRCGPFDVALRALASGAVDPRPLIDARYTLDDAPAAIAHAGRRGTLKVLLSP
jgi:alcohol dehydrogenase